MPRFDYRCPGCGLIREVQWPGPEYLLVVTCGSCPDHPDMEKLPAAPNFSIQGYNAKNGYSK